MKFKQRPFLREVFFSAERRLEVVFYTSNVEKFLQARLVFQRSGLQNLRYYNTHTDPYKEDYSLGKEKLLEQAISQITQIVGRNTLLFVEDTSLRIESLSNEEDYPGLAVKEWFASTSFEKLDRELVAKGNNRRAIIKSDIALHVPELGRPVLFHGETSGTVATSPPDFEQSLQHPWLTPKTFNGWFLPEGCERRLGEMSLEESWQHDFRIRALSRLVERLEEYTAALNLPSNAYTRRRRQASTGQLFLVPHNRPVFVVVGKTCAGKTTFGERTQQVGNYQWIEASDVVRSFRSGSEVNPDEPIPVFAKRLLREKGADVVARKLIQLVESYETPVVITGFRTLEEIEFLRSEMPQSKVVLIDATERSRFERYLRRSRPGSVTTVHDFSRIDADQWGFGLLRVAEDFADIKIVNEGSLEDYLQQVDAVLEGRFDDTPGVTTAIHSARKLESSQLVRCLQVLAASGRALDCNEISEETRGFGKEIRFNNVNKILKRYPELAQRIEIAGEKVLYKITDAGRTYLRISR